LTGRRPFSKPTVTELLKAHQTEQPEPLGNFRPDVPLELETIIDRMIAKSPFQRFQSAKDLAEKLRTWLHDSGSGRGYSRISTLMAEALRAKQLAGQDSSRPKSDSTKDVDLQLAPSDDEPAHSRSSAGVKSGGSGKMEAVKSPVAKEGSSSAIRKMSPAGGTPPAEPIDEVALPTLKADLLSVPLAEAEIAATLPGEPTTAAAAGPVTVQSVPTLHSKDKEKAKAGGFLESHWALVGVAGGAAVVVIGVLLVLFGPWSASEPGKPPVVIQPTPVIAPPVTQGTQLPPKPPEPPKASSSKSGDKTRKSGKSPDTKVATNIKPPSPSDSTVVAPKKSIEEKPAPPPTPPKEPEKDKNKQTTSGKPSTPEAGSQKQPTPEPTPEKVVDPEELLAGITNIQFNVAVIDKKLEPSVLIPARAAAQELKWTITDKDAATMKIELTMSTGAGATGLMLSAELKCPGPNGKPVSVWKSKKLVVPGDPTKMQPTPNLAKVLQISSRQFFREFVKFVEDVRQTRGNKVSPE
jgi:chitodextrinase